jgi:hypothetical protein
MGVSNWQTFPISLAEGLVTTDAIVEQGLEVPGSAIELMNLEVSTEGGYRKVLGYTKFDTNPVPPFGPIFVQGGGQTGTTLNVVGLTEDLPVNTTFTVTGVSGTYTVVSTTFNLTNRTCSAIITPALASSPANAAVVQITSNPSLPIIEGVFILNDGSVCAKRSGALWYSGGVGWTLLSVPDYGTVTVNGAGQTGTTLNTSTFGEFRPAAGDTFTVSGLDTVFVVVSSTTTSVTFNPALPSSPSNGVPLVFISAGLLPSTSKMRGVSFRTATECDTVFVDGTNRPYKVKCTSKKFQWLTGAPVEAVGSNHVAVLRSTLFFGKSSFVYFSAPADPNNFDPANGAGEINTADLLTGLVTFQDNLVIFSRNRIRTLTGSSSVDFTLKSFTDRIGCVSSDTIQEVNGDVAYMSPDGLRFLSDTDRSGQLGVNIASKKVRREFRSFMKRFESFQSVLIREKSQYRLFGYQANQRSRTSEGWTATQFSDQGSSDLRWSTLKGFKVYSAYSHYVPTTQELIVFSNDEPYVFQMESGNSFDGETIPWTYQSPFLSLTDTVKRKTLYKIHLYIRARDDFQAQLNVKLDFDEPQVIQPPTINLTTTNSLTFRYNQTNSVFGTTRFSGQNQVQFDAQTFGNGVTFSIKIAGDDDFTEFTLDTLMLEFGEKGRK